MDHGFAAELNVTRAVAGRPPDHSADLIARDRAPETR